MNDQHPHATEKIHPASREVLPDDPMNLHGIELDGDADLMLRLLVEEYASMGWNHQAIMELARDPFYQAFHGLYLQMGEDVLKKRVSGILARVGVMRVTSFEVTTEPEPELTQIDLPIAPSSTAPSRSADNA